MVFILGLFFPSLLHFGSLYEKPQIVIPKLIDPISGKKPMTVYLWLNIIIACTALGFLVGGCIQHQSFNHLGLILMALSLGFALGCGIMIIRNRKDQVIWLDLKRFVINSLPRINFQTNHLEWVSELVCEIWAHTLSLPHTLRFIGGG